MTLLWGFGIWFINQNIISSALWGTRSSWLLNLDIPIVRWLIRNISLTIFNLSSVLGSHCIGRISYSSCSLVKGLCFSNNLCSFLSCARSKTFSMRIQIQLRGPITQSRRTLNGLSIIISWKKCIITVLGKVLPILLMPQRFKCYGAWASLIKNLIITLSCYGTYRCILIWSRSLNTLHVFK
jgi:hypothetical protein